MGGPLTNAYHSTLVKILQMRQSMMVHGGINTAKKRYHRDRWGTPHTKRRIGGF